MFTRRRFLQTLGAFAVCTRSLRVRRPTRSRSASPRAIRRPSGIVLWTRLTGVRPGRRCAVKWELAADEGLQVGGALGRGAARSRSGAFGPRRGRRARARTLVLVSLHRGRCTKPASAARAPRRASGSVGGRLRFAFASCQQYEQGYFGAYRHIVADDPDLVVFLGDYIYESSWGRDHVRSHGTPEPYTLDDYRAPLRALQERSGPAGGARRVPVDRHLGRPRGRQRLRRRPARRRHGPRVVPAAARRRLPRLLRAHAAAAAHAAAGPATCASIRTLDWGPLARFYVLDDRQYRSWHACPRPGRRGGSNTVDVEKCARLGAPGRTMLGARAGALARERARRLARAPGTSSCRPPPWRSSTRSPARAGAPGPTAGTATPPRASGCSTPSSRRTSRTPW